MTAAARIPTGRVRPRRVSWSGTLPLPASPAVAPPAQPVRSCSRTRRAAPTASGTRWHRDAATLRRVLTALAAL